MNAMNRSFFLAPVASTSVLAALLPITLACTPNALGKEGSRFPPLVQDPTGGEIVATDDEKADEREIAAHCQGQEYRILGPHVVKGVTYVPRKVGEGSPMDRDEEPATQRRTQYECVAPDAGPPSDDAAAAAAPTAAAPTGVMGDAGIDH
jgi:hypothetical protein